MSDNKKYYYLRLKENFYESEEMIVLQSMPDGYLYSDILMKLLLRSLKNDGKLMYRDSIPYSFELLATIVRHPVEVVKSAISAFVDLGLVKILSNDAIYMMDIQNFVGQSSTEADRQREYKKKIENEEDSLHQNTEKSRKKSNSESNRKSNESSPDCKESRKVSCKKSNMISTPEIEIENRDNSIEKDKTSTSHFLSLDPVSAMYVSVYEKLWQRPHREINSDVNWPTFIYDLDDEDFREMAKRHIMANIQHPDRCFIEYFATVADRYR